MLESGAYPLIERIFMDVAAIRAQIPATQAVTYLNTGWSGPSPRVVVKAITELLELLTEAGPTTPWVMEHLGRVQSDARATFARLLGATPEEVVLTDNTTHGLNIVLTGLSWQPGDEIITDDLEHPSGLVPLYHLQEQKGVVVKIVKLSAQDDQTTILAKLEQAITLRTRLFLLSHIMFTTGLRLPIVAAQQMAHQHGTRILVDGAQAAGHIPLDVTGWECDYYAVPAHKWVLGPGGVGALYIRRDLLPEVVPAQVSYHAARYYDEAGGYVPAVDTPEKFELTTSSAPLLAGAAAAIGFLEEQGLEAVQVRWQHLTEYLRKRLLAISGITVTSPPPGPTASALVTFQTDRWDPQELVTALWERGKIVVRSIAYPPGLRVSVAFFNNEEDLDHFVDVLNVLMREGPES